VQRPHRFPELKQPGNDRASHNSFERCEYGSLAEKSSKAEGCFPTEYELRVLIPTECDGNFLCPSSACEDLPSSLGSR